MSISELLKVGHAARKVTSFENAMVAVALVAKDWSAEWLDQAYLRAMTTKRRMERNKKNA